MTRQTRWLCKPCKKWGLGGPTGANNHLHHYHSGIRGFGLHTSFGFTADHTTRNTLQGWEINQPRATVNQKLG